MTPEAKLVGRGRTRPGSPQMADFPIDLEVSLPSARCETLAVSLSGTVADLKLAAQKSLRQHFLRLAAPDGRAPFGSNRNSLLVRWQPYCCAATWCAFALWCVGRDRIVAWGLPDHGGDSSRVQNQLRNIQQVCSNDNVFAAILADGMVVTWGGPDRAAPERKNSGRMFSSSVAHSVLLLQFWQMEAWWAGAMNPMVATAPKSKITFRMFSRFVPRAVLLLPFWQMEVSWPGAFNLLVVAAPESNISSGMSSRFVVHSLLLLPFWKTEAWWHGAVQTMAVTAPECKTSWEMSSKSLAPLLHLLQLWVMELWWHEWCWRWRRQLRGARSASECSVDFWHTQCFCCGLGGWNWGHLGWSATRWRQLQSPISAQEGGDFCHRRCSCWDFGQGSRGGMGHARPWWRQLRSPRWVHRRKFRSQTSDNMDRWKAEQGREKRKIRREKSRRERVRRKKMEMREKVVKSRNTVFFQWFVAPEGRKVGSLKRRVRSQLARWEMKNCTPLWREAHFEVKMYKTHRVRTTFGSWDVEKVHAVVARSTFPSQNVKKH